MTHTVLISLLLTFGDVDVGKLPKPTGEAIVPADAKWEVLFTRSVPNKTGLTEGPALAPDGSIYFSDILEGAARGMILRYDPKTGKTEVFADDSGKSNGLIFDAQGRLLACEGADLGGRCVSRWDVKSKKRTVIADKFDGKAFNAPNDLVIDTKGNIYFTDPRYLGDEKRELEHRAVYRIDPAGKVVEVTHEVEKPNGIALSPDGKTMYLADHNNGTDKIDGSKPAPKPGAMKIYAFPLGADGLVNGPRRTLVDFGAEAGCDGMCVDKEGNIYLTARGLKRPGVLVINPEGKEIAFLPTGPSQGLDTKEVVGLPSNCTFGQGEESKTLYVTVDKSLWRIKLKVDGYQVPWAKGE